jgi:hypothetical protein
MYTWRFLAYYRVSYMYSSNQIKLTHVWICRVERVLDELVG